MGEFDALPIGSEQDGVIANDISAAKGVHADFSGLAGTNVAETTMGDVILIGGVSFLVENFQQTTGGAGRGIDFVFVMHLGHFDVETVLGEDPGGLTGEPKEGIYADGVVCGVNDTDGFGGFVNEGAFGIGMPGGADDEIRAVFEGGFDQGVGE